MTRAALVDDSYFPEPNTGCWLWVGASDLKGYGKVYEGGRQWMAHRWMWERVNGPIPAGLVACHRCDTPACVNPDHIFIGTQKDNIHDAVRKGRTRGRKPTCERGHYFTPENTRRVGRNRICRACVQIRKELGPMGSNSGRPRQTHCQRGHELTPENTVILGKSGSRTCRTCKYMMEREARKRRLARARDVA